MSYVEFCDAIQALRTRFRFSVWSWGRSVLHNRNVGGVEDSMHLYGLAVDGGLDVGESEEEFESAARRLGLVVIPINQGYHVQVPRT